MNMKFFITISVFFSVFAFASCDDGKTYIELREEEDNAIEKYLTTDGRWVADLPGDGNFQTAENTDNPPFYRLPDDVYMQILSMGYRDSTNSFFVADDKVYFRYTRMSLTDWADGIVSTSGNMNDASGGSDKYYFTYTTQMGSNYSMYFEYGLGIQYPLRSVGNGALLNLVVPSKMGFASEISDVIPYLYTIKYNLKEN